jgi:hypothetical protein
VKKLTGFCVSMFFDICFMFLKSLSPRYLNEEQQQQIARQLERHILTTLERLQQQRGRPHPVPDLHEGMGRVILQRIAAMLHAWEGFCGYGEQMRTPTHLK